MNLGTMNNIFCKMFLPPSLVNIQREQQRYIKNKDKLHNTNTVYYWSAKGTITIVLRHWQC